MSHEIEYRNERYSFAFVGDRSAIWHRKGQQAQESWSIDDWIRESGQNFSVKKVPLKGFDDAGDIECDSDVGLIREDTRKMMTVCSPDWQPAQNADAWAFLRPFIEAGYAKPDTAGVLYNGRRCFVLVKTQHGFSLPGGDETELYILVQISHEYGQADLVLPTSVRVVCRNTLQVAIEGKTREQINAGRFVHRSKTAFSVEKAQALLEAYRLGLGAYAEKAKFLASNRATPEQVRAYINKVFKLEELAEGTAQQKEWRTKHNEDVIRKLLETIETQPGAEMSRGSWWSAFHGVTYHEDHGRWEGKDEPIASKLYGAGAERKKRALDVALEMAR
jgi:phage/plasmid-like protein (TIGR03299 family)